MTIEARRDLARGAAADFRGSDAIALAEGWRGPVEASLAAVRARLAGGESLYGINTGFGKLAKTRISDDELATLQLYLMRSHAAGVGSPLADSTVRLILVLKAASLARGYSGVRAVVIEKLLALVNAGIHPVVPGQGSVGASGDLAPLAHLSLALIGEGRVRVGGKEQDCAGALKAAGIEPLVLGPEGGTRPSEWHAGVDRARARGAVRGGGPASRARSSAVRCRWTPRSAAACRSMRASTTRAASPRRSRSRRRSAPCSAKARSAARTRTATACRTRIRLRCQPQVVGACLQQIQNVARTLMLEANGVSDNPLVFGEEGEVLSAATSTPSRSPSRRTTSRSRSPRSARSPSDASRC